MKSIAAVLATVAVVAAGGALAADRVTEEIDQPAAMAMAQGGSFKVVARVLLDPRGGEWKGTWLDAKQRCSVSRDLRVSFDVDLVSAAGATIRRRQTRVGSVQNCAEGGPNFGFDVTARGLGMACPNGQWRPGRYSINVTTFDRESGIAAKASLYHQVAHAC